MFDHKERHKQMFNAKQVQQLLQPINPDRVLRDGKGHSHVSQQDVLAHLTRVFGFGSFDIDVLAVDCVFETQRFHQGTDKPTGRYDVCYRALVRLTVRDEDGNECHYENGSTATAQNQTRGDGHDLGYKSAISLSVKRAAIALGDQYGLSLYNKGQLKPLVMDTLVKPAVPEDAEQEHEDVQEGVPQQVSLGNDEIEHEQDRIPQLNEPQLPTLPDNLDEVLADLERGLDKQAAIDLYNAAKAREKAGDQAAAGKAQQIATVGERISEALKQQENDHA